MTLHTQTARMCPQSKGGFAIRARNPLSLSIKKQNKIRQKQTLNRKIKILLFFLLAFISSCSIQGLTNDYKKLEESQKSKIVALNNVTEFNTDYIYKVNGTQLKQELKAHPKSIVYIFKNGCTSDLCKPLMVYENYAKENGYKLFLVMDGFGNLNEALAQPITSPLFAIDSYHYQKKFRATYSRYFENDLTNKPFTEKNKEYLGSLFFFKEDKLEKILKELPKT
ncbi:hypothetical protein [Flavobacterium sp.]|uniref:hypothetical protein n=1 Tax=Flavobacterium sp. TaxID=239 RepID=UPI002B4B5776|nr:hypothetical protein [Flavobacterium sp.]HLF51031.1 hypothetical protein [Flavobacterium sp.]